MQEYLSIPDKGIVDAVVVHLVIDAAGPPRKYCTGEPYTPPGDTGAQVVFCQACRLAARRQAARE